jgi:hypothetical protein
MYSHYTHVAYSKQLTRKVREHWPRLNRCGAGPRLRRPPRPPTLTCVPVAQLDRAAGFEPAGRGFESLRARQTPTYLTPTVQPRFLTALMAFR